MIIYSFDPGISTGMALLDSRNMICKLRTFDVDNLFSFLNSKKFGNELEENSDECLDLFDLNRSICVCERIPISTETGLGYIYHGIKVMCEEKDIKLHLISPSQWKPMAKARRWKCSRSHVQHEKDAFNLLQYFIFKTHFAEILEEDICVWL